LQVTIGSASTIRYNDRSGDVDTDAWAYLADAMDTADGGGDWSISEVSGDYLGKCVLTTTRNGALQDGRTCTSVEFSDGLTGKMFGFDSNTVATTGIFTNSIIGVWIRQYLWIPQPNKTILQSKNEKTRVDTVVTTSSPDGTSTRDYYGGVDMREVEILSVPAACIWQHYADDADHAGVVGAETGDQNCALDEFRKLWRDGLPSGYYCRYWPDLTNIGGPAAPTHTRLEPGAEDTWIGDLKEALEVEQIAPYRFAVLITSFDFGT